MDKLSEEQNKPAKNKPDYFMLKIPRPVFTDIALSPLLIIILVAFAFLLGMQTARIAYMDKDLAKLKAVAGDQTALQPEPGEGQLGPKVEMEVGSLPTLGKADAKVTIVEFSDFQCPFCKRFYDETFMQLKKDYIDTGKVRLAFRHYPLEIHPNAPKAAEASECANDQGKFWEYHNGLFEQYDSWANEPTDSLPTKLTAIAQQLGMNGQEFSECVTSSKYSEKVSSDTQAGTTGGASATPTFFVNGQSLVGALPYAAFKTVIDQELAK